MESFEIVTTGKIVEGMCLQDVSDRLLKAKIKPSTITDIFAGKPFVLKKSLNSAQALQYQKSFQKLGLVADIEMRVNEEAYTWSLRNVANRRKENVSFKQRNDHKVSTATSAELPHTKEQKQLGLKLSTWVLKSSTSSLIVSAPWNKTLTNLAGNDVCHVKSDSFYWSPIVLVMAIAIVGLSIQSYVLAYVSALTSGSRVVTVGGILFLLAIVLIVPRLIQPRAYFKLSSHSSDDVLHVVETPALFLGKKTYRLYDRKLFLLGTIRVGQKKAEYKNCAGVSIYCWRLNADVKSDVEIANSRLSQAQTADTLLSEIFEYLDYLSRIKHWLGKRVAIENIDWNKLPFSPITDVNHYLVAMAYARPYVAINFVKSEMAVAEQLKLFAMAAVMSRGSLV